MTLYHYCSNQTFHSIVTSNSLRLSSMSMSNDSQEGTWALNILRELCDATEMSSEQVAVAFSLFGSLADTVDGLGMCFSSDGDMLSQWRGYAEDGHGVSVGFSEEELRQWAHISHPPSAYPPELFAIIYDYDEAKKELAPIADQIKDFAALGVFDVATPYEKGIYETLSDGMKKSMRAFVDFSPRVLDEMYRFKNPAFAEEDEWRLLSVFMSGDEDYAFEAYPTKAALKPFIKLPIAEHDKKIITDVVLGPKNTTPVNVLESFLRQNDLAHVRIERSTASYR